MTNCIFCKIASGEIPCYKVWENDKYLAFLDIAPLAKGMTLVIPKIHTSSYIFEQNDDSILEIISASREVARILDSKLPGISRTKLVFEGLDVSHLHAKLIPMYINVPEKPAGTPASPEELEKIHSILIS